MAEKSSRGAATKPASLAARGSLGAPRMPSLGLATLSHQSQKAVAPRHTIHQHATVLKSSLSQHKSNSKLLNFYAENPHKTY